MNISDHIHGVNIFYSTRSTSSSPSFKSMYVLFDNMPISSVNQTTPHRHRSLILHLCNKLTKFKALWSPLSMYQMGFDNQVGQYSVEFNFSFSGHV